MMTAYLILSCIIRIQTQDGCNKFLITKPLPGNKYPQIYGS